MITFKNSPGKIDRDIKLLYLKDEYSFDVQPRPKGCVASVSINEVELEHDEKNRIICVSGYCPHQSWEHTRLSPPEFHSENLYILNPDDFIPGTSIGLNTRDDRWPVYINHEGWICMGDLANRGDDAIEFVPNCVAVLQGGKLTALWLHPSGLPV